MINPNAECECQASDYITREPATNAIIEYCDLHSSSPAFFDALVYISGRSYNYGVRKSSSEKSEPTVEQLKTVLLRIHQRAERELGLVRTSA